MASSLQIIPTNTFTPLYTLWSWDQGDFHQVAQICEQVADNIYTAYIGPVGETPSHKVVLKIRQGRTRVDHQLEKEYEVYTGPLLHLQGLVVPRCFGFFCGSSGTMKSKSQISCLVLEYIAPHRERTVDPEEYYRQLMLAISKIHQAGINHGNLKTGHVLQMGYSPRIINFSLASIHSCRHGYPTNPCEEVDSISATPSALATCEELRMAEVYHAGNRDGVLMSLEELTKKRGLTGLPKSAGPAATTSSSLDFSHPTSQHVPTKGPTILPHPNQSKTPTKYHDTRVHFQSGGIHSPTPTKRKDLGHTRPPSKIVFGERYPNTWLASRRFSIPTRLKFEAELTTDATTRPTSLNPSGALNANTMDVPCMQLHDWEPPMRLLGPSRPRPHREARLGTSLYRQLCSFFD